MPQEPAPPPDGRRSFLRWREIPASVWTLGLVSLLMDVSSEMIHALLPLYLITVLGTSTLAVGVIEGVAEATTSIVKIFSGALSDRLGNRKLLAAAGYGLAALSKPVFPLAGTIGWIIVARFLDRVGKGIRGAPRDALIADLTPADMRGGAFGLRQSLDTVGAALGPVLAMLFMVLTASHFTIVFWIAVVPAWLSFALIAFYVSDPPHALQRSEHSPLALAAYRRFPAAYWRVVAVAAAFTLARFSEAFLILRAQSVGVPLAFAPTIILVMNVVYALAAWPSGALSDRIGRQGLLAGGFAILAVADLALAFGSGFTSIALGGALWGLHMGLTQGLLASLIADTAPADLRGTAFGLFNLITGAATLAASVIAGALWDAVGPTATFVAGAVFTLLALAALPAVRRPVKGQ
jgi:MFS family permease